MSFIGSGPGLVGRLLFESETEAAVRYYADWALSDSWWEEGHPDQFHEDGRELLLEKWDALSPYSVHVHSWRGQRVDLDQLYNDTDLLADAPVVFRAFVTQAFPYDVPGYPTLVYQDLTLGVKGQASARCLVTTHLGDRVRGGDYVEVRGVAIASGRFPGGGNGTFLACASAAKRQP